MMQSYGDFLPIPRKLPNYSRSCMDKLQTSGQIGEIVPIPVQKQSKTYMNVTQAQVVIPPRTKHTMSGVECGSRVRWHMVILKIFVKTLQLSELFPILSLWYQIYEIL